jgi:type II secretory pathway pseudopilin PulG
MSLIVLIVIGVAALAALVVLAIGIAASRSRRQVSTRRSVLLGLAKVRSPSGKSFFPNDDSVLELAELLDDVDERRRRES